MDALCDTAALNRLLEHRNAGEVTENRNAPGYGLGRQQQVFDKAYMLTKNLLLRSRIQSPCSVAMSKRWRLNSI